jgi:phosphonate transport system substrate-binding protein
MRKSDRFARLFSMLVLALFLAPSMVARAGDALIFGMLPYVSPGELVRYHSSLKAYLSRVLGRPVVLVTAPDFDTFRERTRRGEYDIVFTAPHLGRLAEVRDGYRPLARTMHQVQGMFVTRRDSGIRRLEDLRGKRIMMAEPYSMIFLMAQDTLRRHGLVLGRDLTLVRPRTPNNALYGPLRREADAALTGVVMWRRLEARQKDKLRLLDVTARGPGFIVLANGRVPKALAERLKQALFAFNETAEGKTDFTVRALKGFGPLTARDLLPLDPYVKAIAGQ